MEFVPATMNKGGTLILKRKSMRAWDGEQYYNNNMHGGGTTARLHAGHGQLAKHCVVLCTLASSSGPGRPLALSDVVHGWLWTSDQSIYQCSATVVRVDRDLQSQC